MIHKLPMADYLAMPGLSSSHLKVMAYESPADFKAYETAAKESKSWQDLGEVLHTVILEPEELLNRYALAPRDFGPRNRNPGKKDWEQFLSSHQDKICLSWEDTQKVSALQEVLKTHRAYQDLCKLGFATEVTASAGNPMDIAGYEILKARADCIAKDGIIWDVKTTSVIPTEQNLMREVLRWHYPFQAVHHSNVMREHMDVKGWGWVFITTTTKTPHVIFRRASPSLLERALIDWERALDRLSTSVMLDYWPSYCEEIKELEYFA